MACARRGGHVRVLALDWKKAFDGINVDSLLDTRHRFGILDPCLHMVRNMMLHRSFYVEDQGVTSAKKAQRSGISQGCTLSPLLFIITMTVLMHPLWLHTIVAIWQILFMLMTPYFLPLPMGIGKSFFRKLLKLANCTGWSFTGTSFRCQL